MWMDFTLLTYFLIVMVGHNFYYTGDLCRWRVSKMSKIVVLMLLHAVVDQVLIGNSRECK